MIIEILTRASLPRPTQQKLAVFLDDWRGGHRLVAAVQADTGTGKGRVLLATGVDAAQRGEAVVISVSTVALARQLKHEAALFAFAGLRFGRRFGMRSFISPARVGNVAGRLIAAGKASEDDQKALGALKAFAQDGSGLIEDWTEQTGDLPCGLEASDIALLPTAKKVDRKAYLIAREEAEALNITIQTHALTLIQARSGEVAGTVIFDEADALAEVADNAEDRRLSLSELEGVLANAGAPSEALAALVRLRAKPSDTGLRDALAGALSFRSDDEEVRWALTDARRILTAHRLDGPRRGTAVDATKKDVVIRSLWADRAGWVWRNLSEAGCKRAVFASASLSLSGNPADGLRSLGVRVEDIAQITVSPETFGNMTFRLTASDAPAPMTKLGTVNGAWREAAAAFIAPAFAAERRTLALTPSYDDASWLAERFGVRAQQRGELLGGLAQEMRAWRLTRFVTPAGWVGLDLPGVLTDVVIWRLPFEARDELREELAGNPRFARSIERMLRRLRQGMGRGIRQATDSVTVWVADPRLHNGRFRVISAVPERFRDAWRAALTVREVRNTTTAVRPEQAAFREAVLAADGYRCVITGNAVVGALEAAHRPGRDWKLGHNTAADGWALRADLHRLLDSGALEVRDGHAWFDESVRETYTEWHGRELASRTSARPSLKAELDL
jgi:Rad3-related DNA helicase